jgi:branched-chain amino acid transport system substrate-binding protein
MKLLPPLLTLLATIILSLTPAHARELCLVVPLNGGQAPFGESVRRGVVFAQEQLASCQSSDPLCPLTQTTITVEDSAAEPAKAVSAVQQLLRTHRCDAFIVFGSPPSLAVADILERAQKPTIALGSTDKIQDRRHFIFRGMASAMAITEPLVAESRRLGFRSIASVATLHDGMLANRDAFEKQRQIPYIKKWEANPNETDFRAMSAQLHTLKPDAIFISLMPPQASLFAKQVRAAGFRGQLFSTNQVESFDELHVAGAAFEGLWYSREGGAETTSFFDSLRKRFPDGNVSLAYLGFDAARLLTLALNSGDPVTSLESVKNYPGALGEVSALPNHSFLSERLLMQVRAGQFEIKPLS